MQIVDKRVEAIGRHLRVHFCTFAVHVFYSFIMRTRLPDSSLTRIEVRMAGNGTNGVGEDITRYRQQRRMCVSYRRVSWRPAEHPSGAPSPHAKAACRDIG